MLEVMRRLYHEPINLQESLLPMSDKAEYWYASIIKPNGVPISGGFGNNRETARKIAVAEFLERLNVKKIMSDSDLSKKWGLDLIPTACGFAVGFNRDNTILRSISEAVERWTISKWIDDSCNIKEIPGNEIDQKLDPASKYFAKQFDKVLYFYKKVPVLLNEKLLSIEVGQSMGLKDSGIFPGSSTKKNDGTIWQHSLVESYRHLLAIKNNPDRGNIFPENKVRFFSTNAKVALDQIYRKKNHLWPTPQIIFHRCEHVEDGNYFIARTIVNGWVSWDLGPITRFLY